MRENLKGYIKSRGTKANRSFHVLKKTKCPAVLIECGFLSNPEELKKLCNPKVQLLIAESISQGIRYYEEM